MASPVSTATTQGLTQQELEYRKKYIGASESAAIMGVNPYTSPSDIYYQRVHDIQPQMPEIATLGQALEPYILKRASADLGTLTRNNRRRVHPNSPMQATVDAFRVGCNEIVEAKLTHPFSFKKTQASPEDRWGDPFTDQVPRYYLIQAQHQMHVLTAQTGEPWDVCWIAVMIGIDEFRLYKVNRYQQLGDKIEQAINEFWNNYITPQVPPNDPQGPSEDVLASLPRESGKITTIDAALVTAYMEASDAESQAKKSKTAAKTRLITALGDAEIGKDTQGREVQYSLITTSRFQQKKCEEVHPDIIAKFTEPSSYRRLTVKKGT